ncbi:MAG: aroF [Thermoleophilia bacterium]|nr:aroF [Thermoleophilia bacterium]MCZ4496154.1 aroF [Thermoleophilia bacterium]
MIIVMKPSATAEDTAGVIARVEELGYRAHPSSGEERTVIGVIGDDRPVDPDALRSLRGVEQIHPILAPYKLASRDMHPEDTIITVHGGATFGGTAIPVMAGPCSVEDAESTFAIAEQLQGMGVKVLRGGAFKPRTSPYSFQGLGEEGLKILAEVRERYGMAVVTEVMTAEEAPLCDEYVDILQIGTRNMQNYRLLEAVGRTRTPVLLKRGMSGTIEELLLAAEYILAGGNEQVMLCERGIRTYETATRSTFDINAVPVLKQLTHLPVIVDPSHATGRWDLVEPMSKAAVAAGADGLIIEVHADPSQAISDGAQSLRPEAFADLLRSVERVAQAVDRSLDLAAVKA